MLVCESIEKKYAPYYKISMFSINYLKLFVSYIELLYQGQGLMLVCERTMRMCKAEDK